MLFDTIAIFYMMGVPDSKKLNPLHWDRKLLIRVPCSKATFAHQRSQALHLASCPLHVSSVRVVPCGVGSPSREDTGSLRTRSTRDLGGELSSYHAGVAAGARRRAALARRPAAPGGGRWGT